MSVTTVIRGLVPEFAKDWLRQRRKAERKRRVAARPLITAEVLRSIFTDQLALREGDVVFVHSGLGELNLGIHPREIIDVLRSVIGPAGTMLFPTYPPLAAYDYLMSGATFDVRNSTSHTGLLTELARQHPDAVRSLHPTKSVAAIGPHAVHLTQDHPQSAFPYHAQSPYARIMEYGGKVIGIGVATVNLSFVHCVDDALLLTGEFPVRPYHPQLFQARCLNYDGQEEIVPTYAHDMSKIDFDVPLFMRTHVDPSACQDLMICGAPFFRTDSNLLYERMIQLARTGITIYPARTYES